MATKIFSVTFVLSALASVGAIILLGYGMAETASHPNATEVVSHSLRKLDMALWAIAGFGFIILLLSAPFLPSEWDK
jgi:multisubunit Na+/H+ antiporter MnhB subunit